MVHDRNLESASLCCVSAVLVTMMVMLMIMKVVAVTVMTIMMQAPFTHQLDIHKPTFFISFNL